MAIAGFNRFSVAVYSILVIYQKKLSMPRMTLCYIFKPGMPDSATAALLRRIEDALKSVSLLSISYEMAYWFIGAGHQKWLRNQTSSSCDQTFFQVTVGKRPLDKKCLTA